MDDKLYLILGIEKVKIESLDESAIVRKKLSVQTFFGDGSHLTVVESKPKEFDREVAFGLSADSQHDKEGFSNTLSKFFPTRLVVFSGDEPVGETDLARLEEYKNNLVQANLNENLEPLHTDYLLYQATDDGTLTEDKVGVVQLFIALEKRNEESIRHKFKPPPGYDEEFDCVQDCLEQNSDEGKYLLADDLLIHEDTICGPCGRPDCPIVQHVKQELKKPEPVHESRNIGLETTPPFEGNITNKSCEGKKGSYF